ncbi:MAG: transcriptional regulator FtrA [Pseudomonadota bacterium]
MKSHLVVALAYDQLCTFEFGCVVEVFGLPRPELDVNWYQFGVCASSQRNLRASGGLIVRAPHSLALMDSADTIVIPGWGNLAAPPPRQLLNALRKAHARGARIASICTGVFLLAATGLLDGKSATTHWKFTEDLARRYPAVDVLPDALYVDEGSVLTSAGSAAGLDMMLHMVRSDFGTKVANSVARRLVIPPHRDGGQAQFIPRPVQRPEERQLSKLMERIRRKPADEYSLDKMAALSSLTTRTLQRQFRSNTGMTPIEWVVQERVSVAKELLETSKASISSIVATTGFGSEESLRRHFRRIVGIPPLAYRDRFSKRQA